MHMFGACEVVSNEKIAENIYDMRIANDWLIVPKAGQFAQISVPDASCILPRPISICENGDGWLRFIYQVVGKGTKILSSVNIGQKLNIMAPLGNGFTLPDNSEKKIIAVIGGGLGIPPLVQLTKDISQRFSNAEISVFLGFRSEPFLVEDFVRTGAKIHISSDEGKAGFKGNAVELVKNTDADMSPDIIYACGPKNMLRAIYSTFHETVGEIQVSMEERMACGIGACVGCVTPVKKGHGGFAYKRVCSDGPVFDASEVIWDEQT